MVNHKLLLLVLLIPALMLPGPLEDGYDLPKYLVLMLISAAMILIAILTQADRPINLKLSLPDILVFAFLGWLTLSTIFSENPIFSLLGIYKRREGLLTWFAYATIYFTASRTLINKARVYQFVVVSLIVSIPISVYGILQHFGIDFWSFSNFDTTRSFSTLGNPIYLGTYLSLVLPFSLAYLLVSPERAWRVLSYIAFLLGMAALIYSYSRAAWVAAAISLPILWSWFVVVGRARRRAVAIILFFSLLITSSLI